jgi:DNA-binding transcriptional ArsR family regulator
MNQPTDSMDALGDAALALAALSHPVRMKILRHLCRTETCCCKEVVEQFDLAQSTISQHLRILVDAGLVRFRSERPRSCYCVDREALSALLGSIHALFDPDPVSPGAKQGAQ